MYANICSPIEEIRLGRSVMAGNQELAVLSQTDLTCVEGLSLYVALRASKSQVCISSDKFVLFCYI